MGPCLSTTASTSKRLIDPIDGNELDYQRRFLEDNNVIGEGEFGVVKLVHDLTTTRNEQNKQTVFACKILRKGVVFKNNTIYSPLKPQVLQAEVQMLRTLAGKNYCLKLNAVYESNKAIYIITEYCQGGEMMEYLAKQPQDLSTLDVSRIAYQLLSAVHHCATHKIIHRDIKPENIMFQDTSTQAQLRLIDFGSGTCQPPTQTVGDILVHTTFAGSAFYVSPEMFQRTYTYKTDVWSAGVTLYLLVAGYPAQSLQRAFNLLQQPHTARLLRTLPQLPTNLPDSYYDLLEALLTYRHKERPSAGQVLETQPFCRLFQQTTGTDTATNDSTETATLSLLSGSVSRHTFVVDFRKYERLLTTLLATMLSKTELAQLVYLLREHAQNSNNIAESKTEEPVEDYGLPLDDDATDEAASEKPFVVEPHKQLSVILIRDLRDILRDKLNAASVLERMDKLPVHGQSADVYVDFAYHVTLLREFVPHSKLPEESGMRRTHSYTSVPNAANSKNIVEDDGSVRSASSFRSGRRRGTTVVDQRPSSIR